MEHFGKLVAEVIRLKEMNKENVAAYAEISLEKLEMMLNRDEWTNNEIKQFSMALNYDFGKHLSQWDIKLNASAIKQDASFYLTYNPAEDGDKLDHINIQFRKLCLENGLDCQ